MQSVALAKGILRYRPSSNPKSYCRSRQRKLNSSDPCDCCRNIKPFLASQVVNRLDYKRRRASLRRNGLLLLSTPAVTGELLIWKHQIHHRALANVLTRYGQRFVHHDSMRGTDTRERHVKQLNVVCCSYLSAIRDLLQNPLKPPLSKKTSMNGRRAGGASSR